MVLLVFRSTELHRLLDRFPGKSFFNVLNPELKGYWQFFGRVDLDATFFFHAPVPQNTTRDNFDFAALLHAAAGAEFDVELLHVGFWDLRFAVADSYRKGRLFIAGDAAHSHPPYGGYGINTGFEDAVNLGWKLVASLQGWSGPNLLDSYDLERRPVFASTSTDFIAKSIAVDRDFLEAFDPMRDGAAFKRHWNQRATGARSEVNFFEPNYEGSPIVFGPSGGHSSAVGSHDAAARAGHHLTPRALSTGRNIFEEFGTGFTLLALDVDAASVASFGAAAAGLGVPLKILQDSASDGREDYAAALVLIRPDQFVAWASDETPEDPSSIFRRVIGGVHSRVTREPHLAIAQRGAVKMTTSP
jgi:hypothetical protein